MNKQDKLYKIPLDRLHDIRVLLSRLYRDERHLHKDIKLMLFYIYNDWNEVDETIKKWEKENKNMI